MAQKFDILEALQNQGIDAKVIKVRYYLLFFLSIDILIIFTGYQNQQSP